MAVQLVQHSPEARHLMELQLEILGEEHWGDTLEVMLQPLPWFLKFWENIYKQNTK